MDKGFQLKTKIITHHLPAKERERLLREVEIYLAKREEILFAYAHGSFLADTFFRDLDIAVFLRAEEASGVRYTYEVGLEAEIERALAARFPVDVRVLNFTPISFQYRAICGRLLLDRDPQARVDFFSKVVGRYLDIKPILRHHTREAFSNES